jgi:lactate dehydrogenase-like 2-hydroxyacid dehydrogenase
MAKPRLVVVRLLTPNVEARIARDFDALRVPSDAPDLREATLAALAEHQAEALLFFPGLKFDADFIARIPAHVKVCATYSVGFDHIDIAAAKARGMPVGNTPDVLTGCTADLAFALLLAAARRLGEYERIMRDYAWTAQTGAMLGTRVWGKTIGLVGFGRIGQAMADRARGFSMRVLYHDAMRWPDQNERGAEFCASLAEMLPRCDFVSLHAPLAPSTKNLLNAETLAMLPKGAIVVNAARGGLIDEEALMDALKSGHIAAAGLDVFLPEPKFDRRWIEVPNVFLAPHVGSATIETRDAMGFRCLDNISEVLAGRKLVSPLWT